MTRIATSQLYSQTLARITDSQAKLAELQEQVSTGKRLLRPSDDPTDAGRALQLDQVISRTQQYQDNINFAQSRLDLEESTLGNMTNLLQRIRDLVVQSNTGSLTQQDRTILAAEVHERFEEMISLSNTQDSSGDFLFAGFNGQNQAFAKSTIGDQTWVNYQGDDGQREIQMSTTRQMVSSDAGSAIFQDVKSDTALSTKAALANTGTGNIAPAFVANTLPLEVVTLSFADANVGAAGGITSGAAPGAGDTVTLGPLTYQFVTNAANVSAGNVAVVVANGADESAAIVALESAIDAQRTAGNTTIETGTRVSAGAGGSLILQSTVAGTNTIAANGLVVESSTNANAIASSIGTGGPAKDNYQLVFTAANAFNIVNQTTGVTTTGVANYTAGNTINFDGMRTVINGNPAIGDTFTIVPGVKQDMFTTVSRFETVLTSSLTSEAVASNMSAILADVDKAIQKTLEIRTHVGGRLNALESQRQENDAFIFQSKATLSDYRDVDVVEAISQLQMQNFTLQAAQATFAQIGNLSLFQYL